MSSSTPEATELIRQAVLSHPQWPSRTLARHLYSNHPGMWSNMDQVRGSIRKFRGAGGNDTRVPVIAPPSPLSHSVSAIKENPFYCPPSDEREWKPYVITTASDDKTLILSDIHFPYHNTKALIAAVETGKRYGVERIILNGDTIDCYQMSRFCRDPKMRSFVDELEIVRDFLTELRDHFPNAEIIWKDGNHDERLYIYLMANAPEIFQLKVVTYPTLLSFFDLRIEYVTDKRPILLGKNNIIHGHEYPTPVIGPVNAARGLFLRAKANAVCGHHHQTSEHTENNLKGETIGCWSTGCLCELHPPYMPLNKWNHGFVIQHTTPDGSFEIENKKVIDGVVK